MEDFVSSASRPVLHVVHFVCDNTLMFIHIREPLTNHHRWFRLIWVSDVGPLRQGCMYDIYPRVYKWFSV